MAIEPFRPSLLTAAARARKIFHGKHNLETKMSEMIEMLKKLSNDWMREGLVE